MRGVSQVKSAELIKVWGGALYYCVPADYSVFLECWPLQDGEWLKSAEKPDHGGLLCYLMEFGFPLVSQRGTPNGFKQQREKVIFMSMYGETNTVL